LILQRQQRSLLCHSDYSSAEQGHMSWATPHITCLRAGETVSFRPRGHSMRPRIESGDLCTVVPVEAVPAPRVGDVVLCRVRGADYLHLIKAVRDDRYLIGNNRGGVNGWVGLHSIYGQLVSVTR